jgi:hypothetical protein
MAHGNFNWGYILAVYLLWFVSIRDYSAWSCSFPEDGGAKKALSILFFILGGLVLIAHFISGIYYLYYLIVLGNGI